MNANKIAGLIGLLIAIAGAFVEVPYGATALVLIGLFVGWSIIGEHHVRVIVTALALASLSGVFNDIPAIGGYLASIFGSFGKLTAGASMTIISCNVYNRFKP